jgi:ferritin-like metal-binding protein YciE
MSLNNLHDVFEHELKALHAGETLTLAALRQMASETRDPELRAGFEAHERETQDQVRRIEVVLRGMHATPEGGRSPVVEGLAEEKRIFLLKDPSPEMLEAYNVAEALKTEHIEVTCYENLLEIAHQLGADELAAPLRESLREEQAMLVRVQQVFRTMGATHGAKMPRPSKTEMRRSNVGK